MEIGKYTCRTAFSEMNAHLKAFAVSTVTSNIQDVPRDPLLHHSSHSRQNMGNCRNSGADIPREGQCIRL